jgi:hypothetical protein
MRPSFANVLCLALVLAGRGLAQSPGPGKTASVPGVDPAAATPCSSPMVELPACTPQAGGSLYADVDYLLFWFKPVCLNVPVVTIGNPAQQVPGALGQPGTQIATGGNPPFHFDFGGTSGGELTLGWLNSDRSFGVEVNGLLMDTGAASQGFVAGPNGSPNSYLAYQAPDNSFKALPFTVPGSITGSSTAIGSTHLWGVEANALLPFNIDRGFCGGSMYGAFLVGGRYLDLTDRDKITNTLSLVANPNAFAIGMDENITRNQFYGPQVGETLGLTWGSFSLENTLKLAAGLTHQVRVSEGAPLIFSTASSTLLVPGPLINLPSNIGRETADRVTLVPEIDVRARLRLNSWCTATLGYKLIYWNKVLCPGDQMDPLVNVTQLPGMGPVTGPPDPKPLFVHTDYFAQGLEAGVEFRF